MLLIFYILFFFLSISDYKQCLPLFRITRQTLSGQHFRSALLIIFCSSDSRSLTVWRVRRKTRTLQNQSLLRCPAPTASASRDFIVNVNHRRICSSGRVIIRNHMILCMGRDFRSRDPVCGQVKATVTANLMRLLSHSFPDCMRFPVMAKRRGFIRPVAVTACTGEKREAFSCTGGFSPACGITVNMLR